MEVTQFNFINISSYKTSQYIIEILTKIGNLLKKHNLAVKQGIAKYNINIVVSRFSKNSTLNNFYKRYVLRHFGLKGCYASKKKTVAVWQTELYEITCLIYYRN